MPSASVLAQQEEALAAWSRDLKLLESEQFDVRNPKTGKFERREHLWVPVRARLKEKAHDAIVAKKAVCKQRVANPDASAMVL